MVDLLASPAFNTLLPLFCWVPFALAAYLLESGNADRARRSLHKLAGTIRYIGAKRPTAPRSVRNHA